MSVKSPVPADLREYLAVVRARKWTIIAVTGLVLGAALASSLRQTPLYRSRARVLVAPIASVRASYYPNLKTEAELIASDPIAARVKLDLKTERSLADLLSEVTAHVVPSTEVIYITYTSIDPAFAQAAANSFANSYIKHREQQASAALAVELQSVQKPLDDVTRRLAETKDELVRARGSGDQARLNALESEQSALSARLGVLQQRLLDLQREHASVSGGQVIEPAALPATPFSPRHERTGALAAFVGLFLGVAAAFLRERLSDRFRGRPDVEEAIQVPVLATVPKFHVRDGAYEPILMSDPWCPASESFRSLRTSIQFLATQREIKSVLVTSPGEGDGKTVTTANLGIALAQTGRRVIVVSADLRRPALERYFNVNGGPGLSDWLLSRPKLNIRGSGVPNLFVLGSGPVPSNPAELLTSPRLGSLISELEGKCDIMLLDSPPALAVADASIIASCVGGTLLVIDAAATPPAAASEAKDKLERVGATIIGGVLNAFDPSTSSAYYRPYYRTYRPPGR